MSFNAPALEENDVLSIKNALRENSRLRTGQFRKALKKTADDPVVFNRFLGHAYERYTRECRRNDQEVGSNAEFVKWLLQWIIDNQTSIMKFIMAIIALFG